MPWSRYFSTLRRDVFRASWAVMFVIELSYKVDLAEIDAHMAAHVKFLKKYYAAGNFLVSGRKIPRNGGIILAVGENRRQIEAIIEEDPSTRSVSPTFGSSSSAPASGQTTFRNASTAISACAVEQRQVYPLLFCDRTGTETRGLGSSVRSPAADCAVRSFSVRSSRPVFG